MLMFERRRLGALLYTAVACAIGWAFCGSDVHVEAADAGHQALWLIDTRAAPECGRLDDGAQCIRYWQLDDDCCWALRNEADSHARSDSAAPLVIFVHGMRTGADSAAESGYCVYRMLQKAADQRAFRCVIWSWPADPECRRVRRDARQKAVYSDAQSYYLAQWLSAVKSESPVCLIGHSLGARIITGALHMMAGGELAGRSLTRSPPEDAEDTKNSSPRPIRVMLLAAAIDWDSLLPDHRNGLALSLVEQAMVTQNCCDRVLRFYPRIGGRCGPEAIGRIGPALPDDANQVDVVDVSCSVGKPHNVYGYIASDEFRCRLAHYAFLEGDKAATDQP